MPWTNSSRRDRLPPEWPQIRRRILRRDGYMCQWVLRDGTLCLDSATDVDHKQRGDDHREENLQSLCPMHHARKSAGEGGEAKASHMKRMESHFKRTEDHPGAL